MEHPWRRLRQLPHWRIEFATLQGDVAGLTCHETKTIVLDPVLTQAERRCTLAHELEHVERGPLPLDPRLAAREEVDIERTVARRLIPIEALCRALQWSDELSEVADELWVDRWLLETRLRTLSSAESAQVEGRLGSSSQ